MIEDGWFKRVKIIIDGFQILVSNTVSGGQIDILSGFVLLKLVESLIWCKESLSILLCLGCVRYNSCIVLIIVCCR